MNLVKKSLIRKLTLYLVVFVLIVVGFFYGFYYLDGDQISLEMLVFILGFFLVSFLSIFYFDVVRPMRSLLDEVQKLLLGKPYKRIFTTRLDEIGVLAYFFNKVTASLGEVSYSLKDRERMIDELEVASQLQRDILPLKTPSIEGLQIVAKNKPASEVGGDSFDIFTVNNKTFVYLGDVTGHGVAAGLIMTMVNSLVSVFSEINDSALEIVVNVNKYIKRHIKKAMFMTMVMLSWDANARKMTYVGAGHEYILLYRSDSGEVEELLSGGVALGMVPDNRNLVKEQEIELSEGDFVVLYSDGITEARNNNEELYGLENLKRAIREYAAQYSAEGVNYHVAKDVTDFMQDHVQIDDMTLIVIKRDSESKGGVSIEQTTEWKD
jgi:serine phosphatase RsbU (regulator of sigma subunit)